MRTVPAAGDAPIRGGDVGLAVLAYLPLLFIVPLLLGRGRRFVSYHGRQGLYLFTIWLIAQLVFTGLFAAVTRGLKWPQGNPFVVGLAVLVTFALLTYVVAMLWMVVAVLRKKMTMLPVLGELAGER